MKTVVLNRGLSCQGGLGGVSDTLPDHPPTPVWEDSNILPYSAQEIEEEIGESEEWDSASHEAEEIAEPASRRPSGA
ncbi:MAG: hypothetical protein WBX22_29045 [Silvibacterium sp.]